MNDHVNAAAAAAERELESLNRDLQALYYRKKAEERGMQLHVVRLAAITSSIAEGEDRRRELVSIVAKAAAASAVAE